MSAKVSIVVTTYNGAKYLAAQLDSILAQTHHELEILISDDASTDDTWAVAQHYAEKDTRIQLFRHEKNVGLHANLNAALAKASGEYIAISDQDDIWLPHKIEKQLSLLGGAVGVYSDSALIDTQGQSLGKTLFQTLNIKPNADSARTVPLFLRTRFRHTRCCFTARCCRWRCRSAMILFSIINWRWPLPVTAACSTATNRWCCIAYTAAITPMRGWLGKM